LKLSNIPVPELQNQQISKNPSQPLKSSLKQNPIDLRPQKSVHGLDFGDNNDNYNNNQFSDPMFEYHKKEADQEIANINLAIDTQHQLLSAEIDKLKAKAMEYKYQSYETHAFLDAVKSRILITDEETESEITDSEKSTGIDIPSNSKFIPLNQ